MAAPSTPCDQLLNNLSRLPTDGEQCPPSIVAAALKCRHDDRQSAPASDSFAARNTISSGAVRKPTPNCGVSITAGGGDNTELFIS